MTDISMVPPCMAVTDAWSLPSVPLKNRLTLILPPERASTRSLNFLMPGTEGWVSAPTVPNLMVRSLMSCAAAVPATAMAATATLANTVLINSRFMRCLLSTGVRTGARSLEPQ